jgi:protein-S-isoprenylcysteine O-methyltransferase Ste14
MNLAKGILFALFSILLAAIFWRSLINWRKHGFTRFFAFEALLGLVFLNAQDWFLDPLTPRQILSWVFLTSSLLLAVHGFRLLQTTGQPEGPIERTTQLVTAGAYKYIRHPLYGSLILLGVGIYLKGISMESSLLFLLFVGFIFATAKLEESENLSKFGSEYHRYMQGTKMFIPFIF